MSITCPRCESEHTQKFSLIYRNGTAQVTLASAAGSIGNSDNRVGTTATSGTTQSQLAAECAPPARLPFLVPLIAFLIGGCVLSLMVGAWANAVVLIGAFAYVVYAIKHYFSTHAAQMRHWEAKFLCLRCGTAFLPKD